MPGSWDQGDSPSSRSSVFQWGRGSTTIDFPVVIMFDMIRSNLRLSPQVVLIKSANPSLKVGKQSGSAAALM